MRLVCFILLFLFASAANAQQSSYVCSYPAYLGKEPVLVNIRVNGKKATVENDEYVVLQDTDLGVVLARSFAQHNKGTRQDDLGLFGVLINKKTLRFTRGNVIHTEPASSIADGICKKQ